MNPQQLLGALAQLLQLNHDGLADLSRTHLAGLEETLNKGVEHQADENKRLVEELSSVVFDFGGGGGGGGGAGGGAMEAIAGRVARQIAMIFAPLIAFSTLLNQSTSGLSLFLGAINILGGTIAPLLLPVFTVLAAAIVVVSDEIWQRLLPTLKDYNATILGQGIAAIETFAQYLVTAAGGVDEFARQMGFAAAGLAAGPGAAQAWKDAQKDMKDLKGWNAAHGNKFDLNDPQQRVNARFAQLREELKGDKDNLGKWLDAIKNAPNAAEAKRIQGMGPGAWADEAAGMKGQQPGVREKMFNAVDLVLRQLQMQTGSKASLTGIAQASRQAQLAAVSQDPFAAKQLQVTEQVLQAIRAGFAELVGRQKREVILV